MNRTLWTQPIFDFSCPAWPCPVCEKGTLALIQGSLTHKETADSESSRRDEEWEPDWIRYHFTAWAECGHIRCKQKYAIAGVGTTDQFLGEDHEPEWMDVFTPQVCLPMPDIFVLPTNCPDDVAQELRSAFALFLSSKDACAGRIRVALECLMDNLHIPKKRKNKKGGYFTLTLHARIEAFAVGQPSIGQQLLALKWLGNSGSHKSKVTENDLLDGFEILEHTLEEVIGKRSATMTALAKKMTKKHGGK
jgi:hypothetical protein